MDEKMSICEALQVTINLLGNISVPRVLNQAIGIPIDNAIGNLQACVEAINNRKVEENQNGDSNAE